MRELTDAEQRQVSGGAAFNIFETIGGQFTHVATGIVENCFNKGNPQRQSRAPTLKAALSTPARTRKFKSSE